MLLQGEREAMAGLSGKDVGLDMQVTGHMSFSSSCLLLRPRSATPLSPEQELRQSAKAHNSVGLIKPGKDAIDFEDFDEMASDEDDPQQQQPSGAMQQPCGTPDPAANVGCAPCQ